MTMHVIEEGAIVVVFTLMRPRRMPKCITRVRALGDASDRTPVVWLEGIAGYYAREAVSADPADLEAARAAGLPDKTQEAKCSDDSTAA